MTDEDEYPEWLYRDIVEDSLPWERKSPYDLLGFFEKYTLHDSNWVGSFLNVAFNQDAILSFQWDSVWLPDNIKEGSSRVFDWPYLFIKLSSVIEVSTSNYVDIDGMSRSIGNAEVELINGKNHLAIEDVYGGQVNVLFQGDCSIIALNPDKTVLAI